MQARGLEEGFSAGSGESYCPFFLPKERTTLGHEDRITHLVCR